MKLAEKSLALGKRQGMSQEDLAEKLNVSRQAVSRRKAKKTTSLSAENGEGTADTE